MAWNQNKWFLYFKGVLLVWLALVVIDLVLLYIAPREYLGRIRLQILPNAASFEVFPENSIISPHLDYSFVADQMQTVTSKETLYDVIEELQLVKKWDDAKSPADAYAMLLDKIETEHLPHTSMIDVEIFHTDPQEAADLANAIGQAYRRRRTEIETARAGNALDMLNAQLSLQDQKVEDARQTMINLMEKFDIADLGSRSPVPPSADSPITATHRSLTEALASYHRKMREVSDINTRLEVVGNLDGERRIDWFLREKRFPTHARKALEGAVELQGQLTILNASGLVDSDPQMIALQRKIDAQWQIVRSAVDDTNALMMTEEEIVKKSLENQRTMVEALKDDLMSERKSYVQYTEAKRAFDMQSQLAHDMRRTLLQQKVNLSLPKNPTILHEIAEANEVAARPLVPHKIAVNLGTNFLWAIPGGLIVMYISLVFFARRDHLLVDMDDVAEAVEVDYEEQKSDDAKDKESW